MRKSLPGSRRVLIALLLPAAAAVHAGESGIPGWHFQHPVPTSYATRSISCADSLHYWVVQADGAIAHTRDGGVHWTRQHIAAPGYARLVWFTDPHRGWVGTSRGRVYRTRDGGQTWHLQLDSTGGWIADLEFSSQTRGWVVYSTGRLLRTSDGGESWRDVSRPGAYQASSAFFVNDSVGWVGEENWAFRTDDGGASWNREFYYNGFGRVRDIHFVDELHGWIAGNHASATADGGATWDSMAIERRDVNGYHIPDFRFNSVRMLTPDTGWVFGSGTNFHVILTTFDGGATFSHVDCIDISYGGVGYLPGRGALVGSRSGKLVVIRNLGASCTRLNFVAQPSLYSVSFADAMHGWTVGFPGDILHTVDGGSTWELQRRGQGFDDVLNGVCALSRDSAWVVGELGFAARTVDGGTTWQRIDMETTRELVDIAFTGESSGWIVGEYGTVRRSRDRGENWERLSVGSGHLHRVAFLDDSLGWIAARDSVVYRTRDGGESWATSILPIEQNWASTAHTVDICLVTDSIGFAVTSWLGQLYRTRDWGATWENVTAGMGSYPFVQAGHFHDTAAGYLFGGSYDDLAMFHTRDAGETWNLQYDYNAQNANDVFFLNDTTAWAVGGGGQIVGMGDPPPHGVVYDVPRDTMRARPATNRSPAPRVTFASLSAGRVVVRTDVSAGAPGVAMLVDARGRTRDITPLSRAGCCTYTYTLPRLSPGVYVLVVWGHHIPLCSLR